MLSTLAACNLASASNRSKHLQMKCVANRVSRLVLSKVETELPRSCQPNNYTPNLHSYNLTILPAYQHSDLPTRQPHHNYQSTNPPPRPHQPHKTSNQLPTAEPTQRANDRTNNPKQLNRSTHRSTQSPPPLEHPWTGSATESDRAFWPDRQKQGWKTLAGWHVGRLDGWI